MSRYLVPAAFLACLVTFAPPAVAGGAWLPAAGDGDIQLGWSRKQAHTSWDTSGSSFTNTGRFENHDFRYLYLSGEIGLVDRLSFTFLVTHLDGREGPTGDLEQNVGPSDAWFGVKYALSQSRQPMALKLEMRTDYFYDVDGPYERDQFDEDGNFLGHSPEWRGILKEDYSLYYLISRSFAGGQGWGSGQVGYTYREGAPADQLPVYVDGGWWIPGLPFDMAVKADALWVRSLGNDSPRQPDDRFGARPGFNFNDASMGRIGFSLHVPWGPGRQWWVDAGFNSWVWGRSARQYDEPYFSVGRRF